MNMENEIKQIEEGAKKKESYIRDRTEREYAEKINKVESKLAPIRNEYNAIENSLNELRTKMKELKKRKDELTLIAQPLMKELKKINKDKEKFLNKGLKAITKEKNIKMKSLDK